MHLVIDTTKDFSFLLIQAHNLFKFDLKFYVLHLILKGREFESLLISQFLIICRSCPFHATL